jgi:hypothetical protein
LRNTAERILRSRSVLHGENADLASACEAGNGVGHVKTHAFLANDDRPYACAGGEFENVVHRIAEDKLDALAL